MLPHLDAAYNLARWLLHDPDDAQDIVQDAFLKAFRHFATFRGSTPKAWLLAIVRNTAYSFLKKKGKVESVYVAGKDIELIPSESESAMDTLERASDAGCINHALAQLSTEYREAIVLRELEGLTYKEIAAIAGVPIGTVMSRIARARVSMKDRIKKLS